VGIFFMHIHAAIHLRYIGHEDVPVETADEDDSSKIVL